MLTVVIGHRYVLCSGYPASWGLWYRLLLFLVTKGCTADQGHGIYDIRAFRLNLEDIAVLSPPIYRKHLTSYFESKIDRALIMKLIT